MKEEKKTKKRKKVTQEETPKVPKHVKDAVQSLGQHVGCPVEARKEKDEWVLVQFGGIGPDVWKSLRVRRI